MSTIPKYVHIGANRYKTQRSLNGRYTLWRCYDICSLRYIGQCTENQLLQLLEKGKLN